MRSAKARTDGGMSESAPSRMANWSRASSSSGGVTVRYWSPLGADGGEGLRREGRAQSAGVKRPTTYVWVKMSSGGGPGP